MNSRYHVVIVGAGVAGMAAADTLAGRGLDILIIDENRHAGGQMLRETCRVKQGLWKFNPAIMKIKDDSLSGKLGINLKPVNLLPKGLNYINQAEVIGLFQDSRLLVNLPERSDCKAGSTGGVLDIKFEYLIFATGARERYLPFRGWTIPGVISLGAAQILMKSSGILPARSTLIAGTSPLQMVLAGEILKNRGEVPAILDEKRLAEKFALLPLLKGHISKIGEGAAQILNLTLKGVRIHQGVRVVEARGKNRVESVVTRRVDNSGKTVAGTEKIYPAEALAAGYGFTPNIELPIQAGCRIEYSKDKGGWVVKVDEKLQTSVRALYAAGETTGIAGAGKSYFEGRLAASSILEKFGIRHSDSDAIDNLVKSRSAQTGYGVFLNRLCAVLPSAYREIPDETLICRCEEISMGEIRKNIELGFQTSGSLKKATRCGMGRCQGRVCHSIMLDILLSLTKKNPEDVGKLVTRAPVKNISINAFLKD